MLSVAGLVLERNCILRGIQIGSKMLMEELMRFVIGKGMGLPVDRVFGFEREEVVAAYECLKGGWHVGKVCIGFVKC